MGEGSFEEQPIWTGRPSHVINLKIYAVCILFCWLIVPLFYMLWKALEVHYTEYILSSERLRMRSGVLSKRTHDLELYRVKDYTVQQPFWLRLFSVADLYLETSDKTSPHVVLRAVPNAEALTDLIRNSVEALRKARGVRELDFEANR